MLNFDEYINFIKIKHGDQKRKQGSPYYSHPVAVASILKDKGFSEEYQIVGLFHDLLEDTDCTEQEILEISNEEILKAVKLLTKTDGYVMDKYIENIKKNEMARVVKLADRLHNLKEARYCSKEFQEKYIKETKDWFIDLSKETVFEEEIKEELNNLIKAQES